MSAPVTTAGAMRAEAAKLYDIARALLWEQPTSVEGLALREHAAELNAKANKLEPREQFAVAGGGE